MSEWINRIKGHQAWAGLAELGAAIDQALAREGIDSAAIDSLERVRAVLSFCGKRLASVDPVLLTPGPLGSLYNLLVSMKAAVLAFATDGNPANLTTANAQADDVLNALTHVSGISTSDDLTAISESASSYKATLERLLNEAQIANEKVKAGSAENLAKLTELAAEIAAEKQKIATAVSEYQTQFSTAQGTRATEFATAQTERQTSYAAAQNERQEKFTATASANQALFSAAQELRAKEYTDAQTVRQTGFTTLVADYTQKLTEQNNQFIAERAEAVQKSTDLLKELSDQYAKKASTILDEINSHKGKVEKLVGVIGNLGVTSGYLLVANRAKNAMYLWQSLTVLALGFLVYLAYLMAFAPTMAESVFLQGIATRIFLAVTVGVFAAYAAKQADKASDMERRNRKLALELEAVAPFIAPLPDDMQAKFRVELGARTFVGNDGEGQKQSESGPSPVTVMDVLKSKESRDAFMEFVKILQAHK